MNAKILDGKAIAEQITDNIATTIKQQCANGLRAPGLAVVLMSEDPASAIYVRRKHQACQKAGIHSEIHTLPIDAPTHQLLQLIEKLNQAPEIDGILIQMPLPSQIDQHTMLEKINPLKDVDGFHPYNLGRLIQRRPLLRPCTPYGVIKLLEATGTSLPGQHAVIVGASNIVGRPLALELLLKKCTVTVCHRFTTHLAQQVSAADILVVAIGKPGVIQSEWIKPGAIVIDVGITRLADGSIRGDIEFESAQKRAAWITPVPGGVGPMTVAILLQNTLLAAQLRTRST